MEFKGRQLALITAGLLLAGCQIPDESGNLPGLKPYADEAKSDEQRALEEVKSNFNRDVEIDKTAVVKCIGANACKGMSACKTAKNACKGLNACKGQGIVMISAKSCMEQGGRLGL